MAALQFLQVAPTGVLAWFATEFLARPIRKYFDLRGEVIERMNLYANVLAHSKEFPDGTRVAEPELAEADQNRVDEATAAIRDLASRMRAFAQNERLAVMVVKLRGHDPLGASTALFGVHNTLGTYGMNRHVQRKAVAKALCYDDP